MKKLLLPVFILWTSVAWSQENKITVKINLPPLTDFVSGQSIVGGIEIPLYGNFSWYNEIGFKFGKSYMDADSSIIPSSGFRVKSEVRYYIGNNRLLHTFSYYFAANIYYIRDNHTSKINYTRPSDTTVYTDAFGVKKNVFGMNLVAGLQGQLGRHFTLDLYAGLGVRIREIHTVGEEYNDKLDNYLHSIDLNIPDIRNEAEAKGGYSSMPNLTFGIRIGYAF